MFMVYFVGFSQTNQILVFGVFEPLESLVNQNIMHHEIAKSVKGDSQSYEKKIVHPSFYSEVKKNNTRNGKNHKKDIVAFEHMGVLGLVMVGMKIPHQSVHDVFVSEPSHTFHKQKNA
jgi:hypothetical protein